MQTLFRLMIRLIQRYRLISHRSTLWGVRATLLFCCLMLFANGIFAETPPVSAPTTRTVAARIADTAIALELAVTDEQRAQGLMHRQSLPMDAGMLFVFPAARRVAFWMKDTALPLSIAYLDYRGIVREIYDLQPFSLQSLPSRAAIRYALEVNRGYFAAHAIQVGDRLNLLDCPTAHRLARNALETVVDAVLALCLPDLDL